jgi:high-affinity Fe2+/Pb2+ permease
MLMPLGVGLILETSYQWTGIGIILVAVGLVVVGWKEHWQREK